MERSMPLQEQPVEARRRQLREARRRQHGGYGGERRAHHEGVVAARDGSRDHIAKDALVRVLEAGVAKCSGEDQGAGLQSFSKQERGIVSGKIRPWYGDS